jgi:hypothetical protein
VAYTQERLLIKCVWYIKLKNNSNFFVVDSSTFSYILQKGDKKTFSFGAADVPADGHFNTGTFQHGDFLAQGLSGTRNFWQRNISAQGHFSTWTFRHSSTGAKCLCRNVHISLQGAKISLCQNVQVPKIPRAEISPC